MTNVIEVDVLVAGSGSAALVGAITAAHAGLDVLLVEKASRLGGTSAWSGGGCWVPNNPLMKTVGLTDSREAAESYIRGTVGNHLRKDLMAAFLDNGPEMIKFLLGNTEVQFVGRTPAPDHRMDLPGASIGGRSLASPVYDARRLGKNLPLLQLPLRSFNAPGGMMMAPPDLQHAMKMTRSFKSFSYMARLAARYAYDRVRYGQGTRVTMGNALVARLIKSAADKGVKLWPNSPMVRLEEGEDGRVVGAVVNHEGKDIRVLARKGVILATGGFSGSPALRSRYFRDQAVAQPTLCAPGNTGDGARMALDAGAVMHASNAQEAAWGAVSTLQRGNQIVRCMHFFTDIPKPGSIIVNAEGKRFVNEAGLNVGASLYEFGAIPAWIICDDRFIRKYGVGLVYPFGINLRAKLREGYVHAAPSLRALAEKIGVDAAGLQATVLRFNQFATEGEDLDFGRGGSALDRSMGDPNQKPNPCLGAIEKGPFYAVKLEPADSGSVVGIRTDALARPLRADGEPIDGLHVVGLDMNSIWAGAKVANGMNHAHNMTFAYIAARHLAGVDPRL